MREERLPAFSKERIFTATNINAHLALSVMERKQGPGVQTCAWDAGALQIFNA